MGWFCAGVSPLFFKSAHPGHPPESQQRLRPRKGGATDDLGVFLPSSRPYSVCFARSCAARVLNPSHPHTARAMAESGRTPQARALLQQCLHARLQVRPAEGDAAAQWVEVTSVLQLLLSSGPCRSFCDVWVTCSPASSSEPATWRPARAVGGAGLQAGLARVPTVACLTSPVS